MVLGIRNVVRPSGLVFLPLCFLSCRYERSRFEMVGDANSRFYQRPAQQQKSMHVVSKKLIMSPITVTPNRSAFPGVTESTVQYVITRNLVTE